MSFVIKACKYSNIWAQSYSMSGNGNMYRFAPILVRCNFAINEHHKSTTKFHSNQERYLSLSHILQNNNSDNSKKEEKPEYIIKFKQGIDLKAMIKEFYSLYGPLFIVSYVGLSICTLGCCTAICYSSVDLSFLGTTSIFRSLGSSTQSWTENGGKFLIAYAMHKITMPLRIAGAVLLTKRLAPRVNWFKKKPKEQN